MLQGPSSIGVVTIGVFDRRFFDASTEWLVNEELRRLTMATQTSFEDRVKWFESLPNRSDFIIRGIAVDGKPVGSFGLRNVDRLHARAEYWSQIGDPTFWGKGLSRWMMREGVRIADQQGMVELYMKVADYNDRAIRASRRDGFELRQGQPGTVEFVAQVQDLVRIHIPTAAKE